MRRFFGPTGAVSRVTVESQALKSNMLGDPSERAVDVYLPAGHDGQGLPLLVDLVGFTEQRPFPHQLGRLPREPAGAARPADRRTAHAAGRRRLSRLLHPARRQPVHQLRFAGRVGGLPAAGNAAGDRAALRMRRHRAPRRVRQEFRRVWRDHACAAPLRHLVGGGLSFRRYGLRAVLPARHAGGAARPRRRRQLDRALVAAA